MEWDEGTRHESVSRGGVRREGVRGAACGGRERGRLACGHDGDAAVGGCSRGAAQKALADLPVSAVHTKVVPYGLWIYWTGKTINSSHTITHSLNHKLQESSYEYGYIEQFTSI